ncbi:hypothetical protein ACFVYA_14635 [Amycolatopsis sp. NPDC058278]|uniref:hypothetical protein n=1 Tax=Amycolatopsis sp. NPDC058278 TaxID=3346417 RepID=UPI0036D7C033
MTPTWLTVIATLAAAWGAQLISGWRDLKKEKIKQKWGRQDRIADKRTAAYTEAVVALWNWMNVLVAWHDDLTGKDAAQPSAVDLLVARSRAMGAQALVQVQGSSEMAKVVGAATDELQRYQGLLHGAALEKKQGEACEIELRFADSAIDALGEVQFTAHEEISRLQNEGRQEIK